jgi:hypothetical protein
VFGSSQAKAVRPARVAVEAIRSITVWRLQSGLARQFFEMYLTRRCSTSFHCEVPGGYRTTRICTV